MALNYSLYHACIIQNKHHLSNTREIDNHEQLGDVVGATAALVGLVCEQPSTRPSAVSSTAASYASPQLGSLRTIPVSYIYHSDWFLIRNGELKPLLPRSTCCVLKVRAHIVRETVLRVNVANSSPSTPSAAPAVAGVARLLNSRQSCRFCLGNYLQDRKPWGKEGTHSPPAAFEP